MSYVGHTDEVDPMSHHYGNDSMTTRNRISELMVLTHHIKSICSSLYLFVLLLYGFLLYDRVMWNKLSCVCWLIQREPTSSQGCSHTWGWSLTYFRCLSFYCLACFKISTNILILRPTNTIHGKYTIISFLCRYLHINRYISRYEQSNFSQ